MEKPYANREIDEKFGDIQGTLGRLEGKMDAIDAKVTYTNGKVRKLTLALVAVAAMALGLGINNGSFILKLFTAL